MISLNNEILYIGKAKNLSKRVNSYANPMRLNYRLQKMVSLVKSIDFIIRIDNLKIIKIIILNKFSLRHSPRG